MVSAAGKASRDWDALMVVEEGKPVGVVRYDLLGFLSGGRDGVVARRQAPQLVRLNRLTGGQCRTGRGH